jgi:sensor histidine kinase YesM
MTEAEKGDGQHVKLNDGAIRLIGIPCFGTIIPNVTGLIDPLSWKQPVYWISYIYFICLAALIWQGNRYLLFRTRRRFTWFDKPIEKLILLVINNVFYTAPVTIAMLCLWYSWTGLDKINWTIIQLVTLINIICVLFVTHVYETVFMLKEQQNEQVKNAELQRAKAEAELIALKNQVDPHFMFNSLNTLTYLIRNDSSRALLFTENLAEVYRYILAQKDSSLVLLDDELDFTNKYTDLLRLRFGQSLVIHKSFNGTTGKNFLIPPTSVFMAFENAVKHNEISEQHPLRVTLDVKGSCLSIENSIRQKNNVPRSSGIGLQNLDDRFRMLTGKGIETEKNEKSFLIRMPLIQVS